MYEITLEHTTDTGHRIVGHKGKCARLHGHTYRWVVTIKSDFLVKPGFVIDFGDVKELLDVWDHRTILWTDDPLSVIGHDLKEDHVVRVDFNPTAEAMARSMAEGMSRILGYNFSEVEIILYETPKARARWVVRGEEIEE